MFRNDPSFNRITAAIHDVVKPFDAVNADRRTPNVLALVNYEQMCGVSDLLAVLTGRFYAEDEARDCASTADWRPHNR